MAFVQISDFRTVNYDAIREVHDEWLAATEGRRTVRRAVFTRDRNDPDRYVHLVFFDSYESAMENSNLPETQASAEKINAVTDGRAFHNLDVIEEWT